MKFKWRTGWLLFTLMLLAPAATVLAEEAEEALPATPFYQTPWALVPAVVAIALALITKEVYSSLFIGILTGGMLYSNFNTAARVQ